MQDKEAVPRKTSQRSAVLSSRPEYLALGEWIAEQRQRRGLEQKPLSRALGKPEQFLNKVEKGRQRIDVVEFCDLMAKLEPGSPLTLIELLNRCAEWD